MNNPTTRAAERHMEPTEDRLVVGDVTIHMGRETAREVLRHLQVAEDSRGQHIAWPRESARAHPVRHIELAPSAKNVRNRPPRISTATHEVRHVCDICGQPETARQDGRLRRLALDHDHESGDLRGWLCGRCNSGIGMFLDSPDTLRAAANYIEKPPGVKKLSRVA